MRSSLPADLPAYLPEFSNADPCMPSGTTSLRRIPVEYRPKRIEPSFAFISLWRQVTRLLRMLKTIQSDWETAESTRATTIAPSKAASASAHTHTAVELRPASASVSSGGVASASAAGDASADAVDADEDIDAETKWMMSSTEGGVLIHVKEMHLEPVVLTANISIAALADEPELQEYHPTNSLRSGVLKQVTLFSTGNLLAPTPPL